MRTAVLAMLAVASGFVSTAARNTIVEMAPNQGCALLVGFHIKTKDAGSTSELRITPYNSWAICGYGSTPSNNYLRFSWDGKGQNYEDSIMVLYSGMAPFNDKAKAFKDFPICIRGPQRLTVEGNSALVKVEDQTIRWDGSYYWFSSDALYYVTVPDEGDPASFPKLPGECHKAGDKTHLDSAVFSNADLLNILPNPYGDQIQQAGNFQPSDWTSKTFTVQLPSATAAPQAKRTMNTSRRWPGRV